MKNNISLHNNTYCVIMAGGFGSRFWPMSRSKTPKQFLDILGTGHTMIQETAFRFEGIAPSRQFYVLTGEQYENEMLRQLPALHPRQILTEPMARNTAPAIAYAAYLIYNSDPSAIMVVTASDHYVGDIDKFNGTLRRAIEFVQSHDVLLTIGITPTYPATGYGYIEVNPTTVRDGIAPVQRFKEKPQIDEAERLLAAGNHYWNSGMFVWKAKCIIDALEKYLPEVAVHFAEIEEYGTPMEHDLVNKAFTECPSISIDYGIMEKADNVYCIEGDFEWDDIGTWKSLQKHLDRTGRTIGLLPDTEEKKQIMTDGCTNTFVQVQSPNKKVVVIGLDDYLVVDMNDLLFIAPKNDEVRLHAYLEEYAKKTGMQ